MMDRSFKLARTGDVAKVEEVVSGASDGWETSSASGVFWLSGKMRMVSIGSVACVGLGVIVGVVTVAVEEFVFTPTMMPTAPTVTREAASAVLCQHFLV